MRQMWIRKSVSALLELLYAERARPPDGKPRRPRLQCKRVKLESFYASADDAEYDVMAQVKMQSANR